MTENPPFRKAVCEPSNRMFTQKTVALAAITAENHPHGHPAANRFMKHEKSLTFSNGGAVLPSQFAVGSPAANLFRKQEKSFTFRIGAAWLPSQLA